MINRSFLRWWWLGMVMFGIAAAFDQAAAAGSRDSAYRIDTGGISQPLTSVAGDPARGREVFLDSDKGNCLACHQAPLAESDAPGTLGPDLSGVGQRWSVAALRLRLVDGRRLADDGRSVMPAFYSLDNLTQVAKPYQGKTILSAQEIEDVIALLQSF